MKDEIAVGLVLLLTVVAVVIDGVSIVVVCCR